MESLRKLGLSKYETEIYLSLVKTGKTNAKQIAQESRVPPTAVYPNLRSLVKKELIQEIKGSIALFEAFPPEKALRVFAQKKEKELTEQAERAIIQLKAIPQNKELPKEIVWLTHGKEMSTASYYEAAKKAKKSIFILGWRFEKVGDRYQLLKEFKKCFKRKIDLRIISIGSMNKKWDLIEAYKETGIKIKYLPLDDFSIVVVDAKECKITLKNRENKQRSNLHINDPALANALNNYFLDLWQKASNLNLAR